MAVREVGVRGRGGGQGGRGGGQGGRGEGLGAGCRGTLMSGVQALMAPRGATKILNFASLSKQTQTKNQQDSCCCCCCCTASLPRVINVKFPLQPHQKYYITQYGEHGPS